MRRSPLVVLALTAAACADPTTSAPRAPADQALAAQVAAGAALHALMHPENEVRADSLPPINAVARASGRIRLTADGTVEYEFTIDNPNREAFVAGHIHEAGVDANGPIQVGFFGPPQFSPLPAPLTDEKIEVAGTVEIEPTRAGANFAERLRNNPENFYLNLHTVAEPGGATRGQLGNAPQLDRVVTVGRLVAARLGLPAREMIQFRLRRGSATEPGLVRTDWGDGDVTYTPLGALPFYGWLQHEYAAPGTYEIIIQGGFATGPADAEQRTSVTVP